MKKTNVYLLASLMFLFFSCEESQDLFDGKNNKASKYSNESILEWNKLAYDVTIPLDHPLLVSRINTMMHLAMHDALNAIDQKYEIYAFDGDDAKADEKAALATAAHTVLVNSLPDFKAQFDSLYNRQLEEVKAGDKKKEAGITLGKQAAQQILELRKDDGAFTIEPVVIVPPSTVPGEYQSVPPFDFTFAPDWKTMQPFSLESPSQFRSGPHPALDSEAYAEDFNEVKHVGRIDSNIRTEDQSFAAKFWYEYSEIGWNRIARVVAKQEKTGLYETARLFALLSMAIQDSYISGWDAKLYWNFWRPYTAIRNAEVDGNAGTEQDAAWEPVEPTPPAPDYPSTHSALGNAGATVLTYFLGDNVAFTITSTTAAGNRTFNSFMEAAYENADSRVMGGLHFRFACDAGQQLGNEVALWTVENYLLPL